MVRDLIRDQAPGNRLRVRLPCPPLDLRFLLAHASFEPEAELEQTSAFASRVVQR